jgi:predicted HAD superfamily Cof-like phosphohydrolase
MTMDKKRKIDPFIEAEALALVGEFHKTFNHPLLYSPIVPTKPRQELRVELIRSELAELEAAMAAGDKVEVLDALCDLQYVLSGTVHECGMGLIFEEAFREVHRSNMSKTCATEQEAMDSVKFYETSELCREPCAAHYEKRGDYWFVYRTSDNKTLKSINYSKPNLKNLI